MARLVDILAGAGRGLQSGLTTSREIETSRIASEQAAQQEELRRRQFEAEDVAIKRQGANIGIDPNDPSLTPQASQFLKAEQRTVADTERFKLFQSLKIPKKGVTFKRLTAATGQDFPGVDPNATADPDIVKGVFSGLRQESPQQRAERETANENQKFRHATALKKLDIAAKGKEKKRLTTEEQKFVGFAKRMQQANLTLDKLTKAGFNTSDPVVIAQLKSGVIGEFTGSTPQLVREYGQAMRLFITGQLRKDSGATITESEFDEAQKTFFSGARDGPQVKENRRAAREQEWKVVRHTIGVNRFDAAPLIVPRDVTKKPAPGTVKSRTRAQKEAAVKAAGLAI